MPRAISSIAGNLFKMIDVGDEIAKDHQGLHDDPRVKTARAKMFTVQAKVDAHCKDLATTDNIEHWAAELKDLGSEMYVACLEHMELLAKAYNEAELAKILADPKTREWYESYDRNSARVPAVSDYGKSNINEAFAEVFAHYVLNYDITRDQMESFRSVLSKPGSKRRQAARRVSDRFRLQGGLH